MNEAKIREWYKLASRLKQIKEAEANLRREICQELFDGAIGEFSIERTIDGITVKATSKVNRRVDAPLLNNLWNIMKPEERAIFEYKPTLKVAAYKKFLKNNASEHVHNIVTENPGMPTLEVKDGI